MVVEKHRRLLREQRERKFERKQSSDDRPSAAKAAHGYSRIYHDHYKALMLFTFGLLVASLLVISYTYYSTGDIFYKGVSLSGGITLSVSTVGLQPVDVHALEGRLQQQFPQNDIHVREISEFGTQQGFTLEAITADNSRESLDALGDAILATLDMPDARSRASMEVTGPSLGAAFFQQTLKAILIAFIFMGMVVFWYFGESFTQKAITTVLTLVEAVLIWSAGGAVMTILAVLVGAALVYMYIRYSIPSTAVILAAFSTICFTIAVVDLMQMRISTAGIAAFLMLIGYSVDTDILLSTRVLKSSAGTVYERIVSTVKTGLTMTATTFTAAVIALLFSQSEVIKEIMIIIAVGIIADVFYTWVQNAGILRWYLEKKGRKSDDA